jgi:hypothetical protein
MSKWLERLKCQHYYIEDWLVQFWPDPKMQYHCVDCNKKIIKRPSNPPINPVRQTNQQYYDHMVASGNAHLVIRPQLGTEGDPKL